MTAFLAEHMDRCPPGDMFMRSGWTGAGADPGDKDSARIQCGGKVDPPEKQNGPSDSAKKRPAASSDPGPGDAKEPDRPPKRRRREKSKP